MGDENILRPMTIDEASAKYGTELFAASVIRALLTAPITLPERPAAWGEINPILGMTQGWVLSVPRAYAKQAEAAARSLAELVAAENAESRKQNQRPRKRSREELANLLSGLIREQIPAAAP